MFYMFESRGGQRTAPDRFLNFNGIRPANEINWPACEFTDPQRVNISKVAQNFVSYSYKTKLFELDFKNILKNYLIN